MVDMRNDGGSANPASTNDNEESKSQKFTAVNNNNGNGNSTVTVSHRAQLPPLVSVQSTRDNGSNASPSTNNSPRVAEEQWQQGNRPGSDVEMSGTSQKRKRSPEVQSQPRAVTPTTQAAQRHLAAHGGGMAEEHSGDTQHSNQHRHQSSLGPEDQAGNYSVDEDMKGNEGGGPRGGTQEGSPQPGAAQAGGGKRKRIFSNRTKTGCITCRRRKKKCDEGKPECSNCKRGGFVCEGYSGKINWQKPPGKSGNSATTPISIQSKTEQPESASASPTPIQMVVASVPKQLHHRPEEARRISYQPAPGAVITIDEAKPSLEESVSPNSVIRQQLPHPYSNEQLIQTPTHQTYASVPQSAPSPLPPSSTPATNHNASSLAAISAASGSTLPRQRSEKDKMIKSELYRANAPELVEERERCKAACWRFNNAATNPNLGISKTEKGRLLLDVLRPGMNWEVITQPTGPGKPPQTTYVNEQGYTSDIVDVQVDAPFTCSYGYNIRLGKDVNIEFGCTILDSCAVTIKARTILSPNVSIYSATHPIDPRKRNGAQGPEVAKPVMIEEDCWLGGNVIVLGGITIGKGSVVGAGSVVTRDVPPFTVVAGNPARVIRGIYQNGVDM